MDNNVVHILIVIAFIIMLNVLGVNSRKPRTNEPEYMYYCGSVDGQPPVPALPSNTSKTLFVACMFLPCRS